MQCETTHQMSDGSWQCTAMHGGYWGSPRSRIGHPAAPALTFHRKTNMVGPMYMLMCFWPTAFKTAFGW